MLNIRALFIGVLSGALAFIGSTTFFGNDPLVAGMVFLGGWAVLFMIGIVATTPTIRR